MDAGIFWLAEQGRPHKNARDGESKVSVDGLVREVIGVSPAPPRSVAYSRVLRTVFASSLGFATLASGSILLIAAAGSFWASNGAVVGLVMAAWFLVVGVLVWVIAFTYAGRVRRALEKGMISEARVVSLERAEGPSRRRLDAMSNGFVAGTRSVRHPLGVFIDRFRYDRRGAASLDVGSPMTVLVDPDRQKVLLDVSTSRGAPRRRGRSG